MPVLLRCFLNGALLTLGFAPVGLWPVGFLALPNLLRALDAASTARAGAWRGFAFGYGFFMAGTYWIANALLVDADKFAWMWPISVLGLSAVMALWFALLGWMHVRLPTSSQAGMILRFAILWVAIEYLRSLGIFGFPWNLLGSMAVTVPEVMQLASLIGTYGLSLLLVLLFTLPCWQARRAYGIAIAMAALVVGYGALRLPAEAPSTATRIRVVQGNIPQSIKWSADGAHAAERSYSALTQAEAAHGTIPRIIIWPETAVPGALRKDSIWPIQVGQLLPRNGVLLTGALRFEATPEKKLWNSLLAISEHGAIRGMYDKHHLVPFGEFVPLRDVLPLDKITPGDMDFTRGTGIQTLRIPEVPPFRPLICYEVIFPWYAAGERPEWLLNVTNDAWYGDSPGPYQHLATARLRAVEQGLPLVRAANTGISAIIDPYGRVVRSLPLDTRGVIDQALPAPLPPTFYARWGEIPTLSVLCLIGFLLFFYRKRVKYQ